MIPASKYRINGGFSSTAGRNPTANTNQYTNTVIIGCTNAQIIPRYEPAYLVLKSFFANFQTRCLFSYTSLIKLFCFFVFTDIIAPTDSQFLLCYFFKDAIPGHFWSFSEIVNSIPSGIGHSIPISLSSHASPPSSFG